MLSNPRMLIIFFIRYIHISFTLHQSLHHTLLVLSPNYYSPLFHGYLYAFI